MKRLLLILLLSIGWAGGAQATLTLQADLQDNAASTTLTASTGTSGTLTNAGNTSASTTTGPTSTLTRAILFDGSNDYGDFTTSNGSVIRNTAFAFLSCWAKCDAISADGYMVWVAQSSTNTFVRVAIGINSTGQFFCAARDDDFGSVRTKTSAGRYLGKWHHFAALVDVANDAITLYVDGQVVSSTGTTTFSATIIPNTASVALSIGALPTAGSPFPGAIAGVRLYNSNESSNLATIIGESTPVVTSGDVSVTEGRSLALTAAATSVAYPTWAITGGADSSLFTIDRDGRLQFKALKYYASPADVDTNNVYVVQITPTNASGAGSAKTINITVTAGTRTGMLLPQSAASATYTAHYDCMNAGGFGGSFPNDLDAVTTWSDVSGVGGVALTQSGATIYYRPGEVNGGGCLRFDSSAQLAGTVLTTPDWSEYTIIAVVKPRQDSAVSWLRHTTPATNLLIAGRSGGYGFINASGFSGIPQSRDAGYIVCTNTKNATSSSTGVPPGAGVRWINGSCYGATNGAHSGTQTFGGSFRVGGVAATQPDVVELIVYRGALSHIETAQIHQHLIDKWGIATKEKFAIVFLGNSMTTGDAEQYPSTAMRELFDDNARNVELYNLAQTGGNTDTLGRQSTMIGDFRTWLESRGVKAVLVMMHGHNDGGWVSAVQTDLLTYSSAWLSGGHKTIGVTLTPSVIAGTPNTTAFNGSESWFVSNAASFSGVAHVNELSWCDETADVTNNPLSYWNADGLHFTATGQVAFGEWIAPKIFTQLQALDTKPAVIMHHKQQYSLIRPVETPYALAP